MVQTPSIRKDSDEISWRDIQGLTWIISEESSQESTKNLSTYACA